MLNPRRFSFGGTAATLTNFVTRILIVIRFVAIVLTLRKPYAGIVAFAWRCALLAAISYILAARGVGPALEVIKHALRI